MSGFSADNYKEQGIGYDAAGNITALSRYQTNNLIDNLTYGYTNNGNPTYQVQSVVDGSGSNTGLVNGTTNYTYDLNGNLATSSNTTNTGQNKSYTYNLLNLPNVVTLPSGGTSTFVYDAGGRKLRKVNTLSGTTTTTDYVSGIQYNNSSTAVGFIQTEEGQAVPNGTGYDYQYFLGDNLGNTRVTFGTKTGSAAIIQKDDYYPFGLEINRTPGTPKNEYLYNKKELQEETQLYDYGARFYDPLVARWTSIDPLAEISRRWTPYNYVENDPIRLTDPDGMNVTYNLDGSATYDNVGNADATNYAWGLKIAGDGSKQKRDEDRNKAKEEQKKKDNEYIHNIRGGPIGANMTAEERADYNKGNVIGLLSFAVGEGVGYLLGPAVEWIGGLFKGAEASSEAGSLSALTYKELQTLTKTYSKEMNAFFESEGKGGASKAALETYKENIERYLEGKGLTPKGNPIPTLTEKVRSFQLNRLKLIEKALQKMK